MTQSQHPQNLTLLQVCDTVYIKDEQGHTVATMFNKSDYSTAHLFVAAPDLLEVVQAMANFDGRNNNHHLKEMAKAAIAKATGESA